MGADHVFQWLCFKGVSQIWCCWRHGVGAMVHTSCSCVFRNSLLIWSFISFGFHHNMRKSTEFLGITLELISELYITNPPVFNRVDKFLEPESFIDNSSVGSTCILREHTSGIFLNSEDFKILRRALDTNIINLNMSRNYPNNIKPPWLYVYKGNY